jgi:hypothetical protein
MSTTTNGVVATLQYIDDDIDVLLTKHRSVSDVYLCG